MEQPLPQCWSHATCFLSASCDWLQIVAENRPELVAILGGGLIRGYMIWYDLNRRYGIWRIFIQICDCTACIEKCPYFCPDESEQHEVRHRVEWVVSAHVYYEQSTDAVAVKGTECVQQIAVWWHVDHRLTTVVQHLCTHRPAVNSVTEIDFSSSC